MVQWQFSRAVSRGSSQSLALGSIAPTFLCLCRLLLNTTTCKWFGNYKAAPHQAPIARLRGVNSTAQTKGQRRYGGDSTGCRMLQTFDPRLLANGTQMAPSSLRREPLLLDGHGLRYLPN